MSADARQVNITRSPIGIPCPVKVRPGTPDAEADESERTEFCAVNAQWLIGSQWCCDVHMLKVCDLLALDFCGIADQAGVPASVYDRPWADRPRADQGEVEKYQRWFVSREGFVCDFCGQRDADWDELCPGRGRRARHRPVADLRPESGLGVVKGARVPAGVKSRPKGTTSQGYGGDDMSLTDKMREDIEDALMRAVEAGVSREAIAAECEYVLSLADDEGLFSGDTEAGR